MVFNDLNQFRKSLNLSELPFDGSTHMEDVFYLFFNDNISAYRSIKQSSDMGKAIVMYRKFIANFVKLGYLECNC